MKNISSSLLCLILLVSCVKEENVIDKLSPEELAYLRQRAAEKCKTNSEENLKLFIQESNGAFGSATFARNASWKYEYKQGTAVTKSATIISWKQDVANRNAYFVMTNKEGAKTSYTFLKITQATNRSLIEQLRDKTCEVVTGVTTSFNGRSASYKTERTDIISSTEDQKTTSQYNFSSALPAYFGKFKETLKIQTLDKEGRVKETTDYTGTLTAIADEAPAYNTYTSFPAGVTQYCVAKAADPSFSLPYEANCSPTPAEFDPVELCRVDANYCSF